MLLPSIGALLLAAGTAQAFSVASPFLMLSSSPLLAPSQQIATAAKLQQTVIDKTRECAHDLYILVQQPGLNAADFRRPDAMPKLRRRVMAAEESKVVQIPSVVGEMDTTSLSTKVARNCGADEAQLTEIITVVPTWLKDKKVVASTTFDTLSTEISARQTQLGLYDDMLDEFLNEITPELQWVLIYTSTPVSNSQIPLDPQPYEMDELYPSALHQDLKRDLSAAAQRRQSNSTDNDQAGLPLFEKYQFLSPGIFMGLAVSLLLLLVLWVGVSAIAGLEVSYMAFSKEMGPQAQNKGKQQ